MTERKKPRTPGPAPESPGDELELREQSGILPSEAAVVKALGIPVGFVEATDPGDVMAGILAEIAAAGSVEKALAAGITEGLQFYAGKVLTFLDFKYQPSEFDPEGWPFVVIKAADEDGAAHTLTTGAKSVVTILALARKTGDLPFNARVDVVEFDTGEGERRRAVKLVAP